jgi:dUTP pyrophosphatase
MHRPVDPDGTIKNFGVSEPKRESQHLAVELCPEALGFMSMIVNIKRVDPELPLPTYATAGSVGFDLICRENTEVAPSGLARIPSNVIVETPPGYMLLLTMRSSTAKRKGLLIPNGVGIIDQDYCGDGDELLVSVYNFHPETAWVWRGERIAQGIFVPIARVAWHEVEHVGDGRGGFGSTGA